MKIFAVVFIFLSFASFCQINDDFLDGDFTANPEWTGNTSEFIVNGSNELQLNGNSTEGGTSYLSTVSQSFYDAEWEFLVKFGFNPSSTNYCNVYLSSDQANMTNASMGYFVKIGNTADEVSLYRRDASGSTMIIDGIDKRLDMTNVNVRVKVTRDFDGNWTLMSDTLGGTSYFTEGSVFDNTYLNSQHFGFECIYTSTRWDKFFFDDIIVSGDPYIDTDAPVLLSHQIIDNQNIILTFNEDLDATTALNTSNYLINNGIGTPSSVSFYGGLNSKVLLELANSLVSPGEYILYYQDIEDLSSNIIEDGTIEFSFLEFEPGMIVINEIMADPTPVVELPDAEFVELYNTSEYGIDLKDWTYQIGTSVKDLPSFYLASGEYVILCHEDNVALLESYGNTLGVPSFPLITNGGQTITLFDTAGIVIDAVSYSDTWYQDSYKAEGGWTLEKIDPTNTCSPQTNWIASNDNSGGTPGRINSVYAENNDTQAPVVLSVAVTAANELTVTYNEPTDTAQSLILTKYSVSPDFGNPIFAMTNPDDSKKIILQYSASFVENTNYVMTVEDIPDFCGNILTTQNIPFIIYNANPYDVVICEIMADPDPVVLLPEVEYIELYNSTEYDLDLSNWTISAGSTIRTLGLTIVEAGGYVVLCHIDDVNLFDENISISGVESFPSLTNGGTVLTLKDDKENVVHTIHYSDTWYGDNFKKEGGYSLEMIDVNNPCEGVENWIATNDIRGGTPGEQNSVYSNGNPDLTSPYPFACEAIAPDTVIVYFNETLQESFANNTINFEIAQFGNPTWIEAAEPDFSVIKMKFTAEFEIGTVYYLSVLDSIRDCFGNMVLDNTSIRFAIADSVHQGDVVINEILFNPFSGGSDFVELYNNSDCVLDLKKLWIMNEDESGAIKDVYQLTEISRLLLPGEFCAVSEDIQFLTDNYYIMYPENLYEVSNIPSMSDDEGNIIIADRYQTYIDEVSYTDDQHYKLLASDDGVSLERINYDSPSSDPSNWHSAAQDAGFATPGYVNSQYSDLIVSESVIAVSPEAFSPDNDGVDDRLTISYNLDEPGYTATIAVYGSGGNFITYLKNNEMLGMQGELFWDGFDNGNNICPPGIYIVYFELFNLTGNKIVEKIPVVLSVKI
ncbi:MAG: lamin tail domain-containing protein [Bacteroidales bacterium]|nr:lamin tail domain-containing protein [Bacteroidales bacterium]